MVLEEEKREWDVLFHWLTHEGTSEEMDAFHRDQAYAPAECIRRIMMAREAPPSLESLEQLLVAEIISRDRRPTKELARKYRPTLEKHGCLRRTSTDATAERRMKEFLSSRVYPRIPRDQLPADVRRGIETGGRRVAGRPIPQLGA